MKGSKKVLFFTVLACGVWSTVAAEEKDAATEKVEKPAMEVGGYVTVDYLTDLAEASNPSFGIGEVDLSANVNISQEVVASVVIKTWEKLDSLWIDQALVSFKPSIVPMEVLFGQQTFSRGLLTTRLPSFPLIYDIVDLRRPGLVVNGTMGICTGGLAFAILDKWMPAGFEPEKLYTSIVNIDVALPMESLVRISSLVNKDFSDINLAGTVNVWKLAIDFESTATLKTIDSLKPSGLYAGVLWNINERFGVALRGDGLSMNTFKEMDKRVAGGLIVNIKDGIYCALELGHLMPYWGEASNEIGIEFGLEQKIELPGFQRKTLAKE